MAYMIVSFVQDAHSRFGDFAKISYRLHGIKYDNTPMEDCFLWEIDMLKNVDAIYLRVALPYTVREFDITPQVIKIQRGLRKHFRK